MSIGPHRNAAPAGRWRAALVHAWRRWAAADAGGAGTACPAAALVPGAPACAGSHSGLALAWASRAGPHHLNQDCAGACWRPPEAGGGVALAVADGVTHGAAGDVAALALVQHWLAGPVPGQGVQQFLLAAEPAVAAALRQHTPEPGAATGAACWLQADGTGWATRVGDCRLLRAVPPPAGGGAAAWQVQPLLPDQTHALVYPALHLDATDADAAQQPARMVGCGSLGEPEWVQVALGPGDLLLLASDGLHAVLLPQDWATVLQRHLGAGTTAPAAALKALANDLLQTAVARGSDDDITVLAVLRSAPQ